MPNYPPMVIPFSKYHGLGNDFIVFEERVSGVPAPDMVRRICDRRFGVGCDGILLLTSQARKAEFGFRIFNSDGSEAETTGNGLRVFSRYLFEKGLVLGEPFMVETPGHVVRCQVHSLQSVSVGMGRATFQSERVPVKGPSREVLEEKILIEDREYVISAANIGNPHCVVISPDLSLDELRRIGPALQNHPFFPQKANVHLVKVISRSRIEIESWERGAAYTLACGSGSSASAAVVKRLGLCDSKITVVTRGGDLEIDISESYDITLRGPVVHICTGSIDEECLLA